MNCCSWKEFKVLLHFYLWASSFTISVFLSFFFSLYCIFSFNSRLLYKSWPWPYFCILMQFCNCCFVVDRRRSGCRKLNRKSNFLGKVLNVLRGSSKIGGPFSLPFLFFVEMRCIFLVDLHTHTHTEGFELSIKTNNKPTWSRT